MIYARSMNGWKNTAYRSWNRSADGYRFGSDAVALAKFACGYMADGARVFDLCSGCGVVGLIVGIEKRACIAGAELDAELCDMSNRSAAMNGLDGANGWKNFFRGVPFGTTTRSYFAGYVKLRLL